MQTILIYIENMGLAAHHNVADFTMIYDMNGTEIIDFCEKYREYINRTKRDNPRIWQNVDRLAERLLNERNTRNKAEDERTALKPTG